MDIAITGKGAFAIRPVTKAGLRWMRLFVPQADQSTGVAYGDDSRMMESLSRAAIEDGLTLTYEGKPLAITDGVVTVAA